MSRGKRCRAVLLWSLTGLALAAGGRAAPADVSQTGAEPAADVVSGSSGGSVRGRLVDLASRRPLAGAAEPFAAAALEHCPAGPSSCRLIEWQWADSGGYVRFAGTDFNPLLPGRYRVTVQAEQYVSVPGALFALGEDEDRDLGDLLVQSVPVRVELVDFCSAAPPVDGRCRFTLKVTNGQLTTLWGEGWAMVKGEHLGPTVDVSAFQVPPRAITLLSGRSAVLGFAFDIPPAVPEDATFCASFYAAPLGRPLEVLAARAPLFCFFRSNTGFQRIPDAEIPRPPRGFGSAAAGLRPLASAAAVAGEETGELSGRLVSAATGQPLQHGRVHVARCGDDGCNFPSVDASSGADGRFRIQSDDFFTLIAGRYEITVEHNVYEPSSRRFEIDGKSDVDLGDIALTPIAALRSISGRLVDEVTGQPLRGDAPPHAEVFLYRCPVGPFCQSIASRAAGPDGSFEFTSTEERPFQPGEYQLTVGADQYAEGLGGSFAVAEDEDKQLGDVPARSYPVRVEEVERCGAIPLRGGRCRITVAVSNGQAAALQAHGWVTVSAAHLGPFADSSWFQLTPRLIDLPPGGSAALPFTLEIPGTVPNGALLCASFYAAPRNRPLEPVGAHDLFCLRKSSTGFARVPDHELPH